MNKIKKLKLCNWSLLIVLPFVLASSIILEATETGGAMRSYGFM